MTYRLDGNLFNLRRLQARTRVTHNFVMELQYADDAAVVSCSSKGLQRNLIEVQAAYGGAG